MEVCTPCVRVSIVQETQVANQLCDWPNVKSLYRGTSTAISNITRLKLDICWVFLLAFIFTSRPISVFHCYPVSLIVLGSLTNPFLKPPLRVNGSVIADKLAGDCKKYISEMVSLSLFTFSSKQEEEFHFVIDACQNSGGNPR